jgi:hypothetical protein
MHCFALLIPDQLFIGRAAAILQLASKKLPPTINKVEAKYRFALVRDWTMASPTLLLLIDREQRAMSQIDELNIVIRHKGGKVIAGAPELSLYTKADDVHAAITALEQKRAVFLSCSSQVARSAFL